MKIALMWITFDMASIVWVGQSDWTPSHNTIYKEHCQSTAFIFWVCALSKLASQYVQCVWVSPYCRLALLGRKLFDI